MEKGGGPGFPMGMIEAAWKDKSSTPPARRSDSMMRQYGGDRDPLLSAAGDGGS